MNFPGSNELSLNMDAVHEMLRYHLPQIFGDSSRVTKIATSGYPAKIVIEFTTDPAPESD